jgi:hypothetical protein
MKKIFLLSLLSLAGTAAGQAPQNQVNPAVKQITDAISQGRIEATLHKLEGFGTRYVMSSQDDSSKGIGAARRWIHDQFQSFSPRLEVTDQSFTVKKGATGEHRGCAARNY